MIKAVENIFSRFFSEGNLKRFEKFILISATLGFIIHLLLILLNNNGYLDLSFFQDKLFVNPISAEEEEIYLKAISDQIQVITKDLRKNTSKYFNRND